MTGCLVYPIAFCTLTLIISGKVKVCFLITLRACINIRTCQASCNNWAFCALTLIKCPFCYAITFMFSIRLRNKHIIGIACITNILFITLFASWDRSWAKSAFLTFYKISLCTYAFSSIQNKAILLITNSTFIWFVTIYTTWTRRMARNTWFVIGSFTITFFTLITFYAPSIENWAIQTVIDCFWTTFTLCIL